MRNRTFKFLIFALLGLLWGCGNGEPIGAVAGRSPASYYDIDAKATCTNSKGQTVFQNVITIASNGMVLTNACTGATTALASSDVTVSTAYQVLAYHGQIYQPFSGIPSVTGQLTTALVYCHASALAQGEAVIYSNETGDAVATQSGQNESFDGTVQTTQSGGQNEYHGAGLTLEVNVSSTQLLPYEYPGTLAINSGSTINVSCESPR